MANAKPITIVIADDHHIVREGIAALCAAQPGLTVVMDRCVKIEHCRFYGKKDYGLDVVGLHTGVLTANRFECVFK